MLAEKSPLIVEYAGLSCPTVDSFRCLDRSIFVSGSLKLVFFVLVDFFSLLFERAPRTCSFYPEDFVGVFLFVRGFCFCFSFCLLFTIRTDPY